MKINIYTKLNGVGLQADANILVNALNSHDCQIIDWTKPIRRVADINIHLEHIRKEFIFHAKYNILMPNPEWFEPSFEPLLKNIDLVICKTYYCFDIFSKKHKKVVYSGFTSIDKFNENIEKRTLFLHLGGLSSHKNSELIRDIWSENDNMPLLFMQKIGAKNFSLRKKNYIEQFTRLPENELISRMNQSIFHICPSKAEGFGHYINEAISTGAIVITTDAPPMNELITSDYGFLVPADICGKHKLSFEYCVKKQALKETILKVAELPIPTIIAMSNKAREAFITRDNNFKTKINEIINGIM